VQPSGLARHGASLTALAPLAWALAAVALARSRLADSLVPALGVLRGPLGATLFALAVTMVLARLLRRRGGLRAASPGVWLLSVGAFSLLAGVGIHYVGGVPASGDEPHYLLMAQSLWRERDLDLLDNLARGDYHEYVPGQLSPHWGAPRADGRPFPAHSPGLPVLLAPAYALGGRRACVLLLAALATLLGLEVRALARLLLGGARSALLAWTAALGPPVFFYAFHVYTEVPSALALVFALRTLLSSPQVAGAIAAAVATAVLPWLHLKMAPAAAALAIVAATRLRGRALLAFACVATAAAAGFLAYQQSIYGSASPLSTYGGGVPPDNLASPLRAAAGLLLDRSFGLLPHAPIYLLALSGFPALAARRLGRKEALAVVVVVTGVLLPILTWRMWWGGQCPPGRFLVPLVPFLALAVAARGDGAVRGLDRWRWTLLGMGLALALFMAAQPANLLMLNRGGRGTRVWAALSGDVPVGRYLPSLVVGDSAELRVAAVWGAAIALLLSLDRAARRSARVDGWFRGLGLPLVLALAVGLLIDRWARPGEGVFSKRVAAPMAADVAAPELRKLGIAISEFPPSRE